MIHDVTSDHDDKKNKIIRDNYSALLHQSQYLEDMGTVLLSWLMAEAML